jgi:hypothetical protein
MIIGINVLLACVHRPRIHKTWISLRFGDCLCPRPGTIQVLWILGRWTQPKSTFILSYEGFGFSYFYVQSSCNPLIEDYIQILYMIDDGDIPSIPCKMSLGGPTSVG